MIEVSLVQSVAERAEAELARVAEARPFLATRCERARRLVELHLSCPCAGLFRARVRGGELAGFLVAGSSGEVYRVAAGGRWACSCPDHHRRSKACKHALAAWALWRASARPAPAGSPEEPQAAAPDSLRGVSGNMAALDRLAGKLGVA